MKRFLDEKFEPIYVAEKPYFHNWPVAGLVMAESSPSAETALAQLRSVLTDCGTDLHAETYFLTSQTDAERVRNIEFFADSIVALAGGEE